MNRTKGGEEFSVSERTKFRQCVRNELESLHLAGVTHVPLKAIEGISWNNLCLYGPYLLVRNSKQAACFKLPAK